MFILLFIFFINYKLSDKYKYANVFNCCSWFLGLILVNSMIIDYLSLSAILSTHYYSLHKTIGEVVIKMFINIFTILHLIFINTYIKKSFFKKEEYIILLYLILISIYFFIISNDILSIYLLIEAQSLCYYILTASNKKNQVSLESGLKYFILSSLSSIFILFGFSIIYGFSGIFELSELALFYSHLHKTDPAHNIYFFWMPLVLIISAFLFKLYVAPFHFWVSDIYQGAPTHVMALFASITTLPMFYVFCKLYFALFYWFKDYLIYFFLFFSVCSMLFGILGALNQKKIKKLLAFSSVSNMGYIFIIFLEDNPMLVNYGFLYFILYIINTLGLLIIFLNLYNINNQIFIERLTHLSGLFNKNKPLSYIFIFLLFASAGMPPFALFVGKILLLTTLTFNLYIFMSFFIIFTAVISFYYYLKIIKYISFNKNINNYSLYKFDYMSAVILVSILAVSLLFLFNIEYISIFTELIALSLYK